MGLCIFFDITYIICKAKGKNVIGLFAKVLAAFCFVTIGYLGYIENSNKVTFFILNGLLLDGIGDVFLGLKNIFAKGFMFFVGTLSFLAGHIMFLRALLLLENSYILNCIVIGIVAGAIVFYLLDRVSKLTKSFRVVGMIYIIMICIMVVFSVGVYLTSGYHNHMIFMLGSILFVSSDIILSLYNFSKKRNWMHPTYSLIYFIAQLLISFSLHI